MAVLAFKKPEANTSKKVKQVFEETEWTIVICREIRLEVKRGIKIYQIAEATDLSTATISNLLHGITRFPRLKTIISLLKYLGYSVYAEK